MRRWRPTRAAHVRLYVLGVLACGNWHEMPFGRATSAEMREAIYQLERYGLVVVDRDHRPPLVRIAFPPELLEAELHAQRVMSEVA